MALEGISFRFAGMNDFSRGFIGGGWEMQNFAHLLLKKFAYSKKKSYLCTEIWVNNK